MVKFACAAAMAMLLASTAQAGDYSIRSLAGYGSGIWWRHLNDAGDVAGSAGPTLYVRGTHTVTYTAEDINIYYVHPTALAGDGTTYMMTVWTDDRSRLSRVGTDGSVAPMPMLPQTGSFPGRGRDAVLSVNRYGVAVGYAGNGDGVCGGHCEHFNPYRHAVVYQGGQVADLGTFGGRESVAHSINSQGTVVGWAHTAAGRTDAYVYADGQMTTLRENSEARRINDAGLIAGVSLHGPYTTAFLYEGGAFTDLAMDGYTSTDVVDLNNSGQLLGRASQAGLGGDYFLYENGKTTMLNDLLARQEGGAGWLVGNAYDINDKGGILVDVYKYDEQGNTLNDSWVLTPVPEPGTWAMLLAGFGTVGLAARRRKAHA